MPWGTPEEIERRRRIFLAVWAYAYEFENDSLVTDDVFDKECLLVDPAMSTGHEELDQFFRTEFSPCTGQWIHNHPELPKVKAMYQRIKSYDKNTKSP